MEGGRVAACGRWDWAEGLSRARLRATHAPANGATRTRRAGRGCTAPRNGLPSQHAQDKSPPVIGHANLPRSQNQQREQRASNGPNEAKDQIDHDPTANEAPVEGASWRQVAQDPYRIEYCIISGVGVLNFEHRYV